MSWRVEKLKSDPACVLLMVSYSTSIPWIRLWDGGSGVNLFYLLVNACGIVASSKSFFVQSLIFRRGEVCNVNLGSRVCHSWFRLTSSWFNIDFFPLLPIQYGLLVSHFTIALILISAPCSLLLLVIAEWLDWFQFLLLCNNKFFIAYRVSQFISLRLIR